MEDALSETLVKLLRLLLYVAALLSALEIGSFGVIVVSHFLFSRPRDLEPFLRFPYFADQPGLWEVTGRYHPRFGWANALRSTRRCGYTTDRYGFVHNGDPTRDFRAARYRIFVVGGSTVAGYGSGCNEFTIPAQLERRIREAGIDGVAVVNAGVPGYYSPLEASFIVDEILRYEPQVIVSVTGLNDGQGAVTGRLADDPSAPIGRSAYYLHPYLQQLIEQRQTMESVHGALAQVFFNAAHVVRRSFASHLLSLATNTVSAKLRWSRSSPPQDPLVATTVAAYGKWVPRSEMDALLKAVPRTTTDDGARPAPRRPRDAREQTLDGLAKAYARYLTAETATLERLGVGFLCVFQPELVLERGRLSEGEAVSRSIVKVAYRQRYAVDDVTEELLHFRRLTDARLREHGVGCADATNIFANDRDIYSDPTHTNPKGNRLIAEFLFQELVRARLLPPAARR